jgi:Uma2 family endonuclease
MGVRLLSGPFTVDDYYRLAEAGLLHEDSRVELLDGLVVQMSPIGSRHAGCVNLLTQLFACLLDGAAVVAVQNPVRLSRRSEPQPDVAILRPRQDAYRTHHPSPDDILLLIEVADTTAQSDRDVKIPLYAKAGIREVWLVDLEGGRIEVYREPQEDEYRHVRYAGEGDEVTPLAFPAILVSVGEVLG